MSKFKIAIIGCGRISYKHIEGIERNNKECELVSVCDIDIKKAEAKRNEYIAKLGKKSNVSTYIDYKKMINNEEIDIVTIATESGYHADIAIYCMEKGKHVIIEKPMALSIEDADKMIEMAEKMGVKISVCHQNRFNQPIQKLRKAVDEYRFGKLINGTARVLWSRNKSYYEQAPWRGTWELDGGTLMNQCIHNIDLLQWMMGGEIESVFSMSDTFIRDIDAEDFGAILIKFKNGAIGIVEGSACVYPKNLEETLSIFGEKGTVCIGGLAVNKIENWRFEDSLESEDEVLNVDEAEPDSVYGYGHALLFKDFIDAIKNDREPLISGIEGKKALSIILAAYKSRVTGLPVQFPIKNFSTMDIKSKLQEKKI
ncbi:Gfo/Idh/MocA family oxidoreductase [Clostridium sediminicola]|uniref:Gfo/Idh/MocA family protein n=1 Tax=Clostridium sediminicola TaxID=3114879 RepID=UPI0031F1FF96